MKYATTAFGVFVGFGFFQAGIGAGGDGADDLTEEEGQEIMEMKNSSNIYGDMVNSVAPTVFGHSEVRTPSWRSFDFSGKYLPFTHPPSR